MSLFDPDPVAAPEPGGDGPPPASDRLHVYTDGACSGNPGPGGWAWVVPDGPFAAGYEPRTTNQRMEVAAVLEALRVLDGPVLVVSDSTYVVKCFEEGWWKAWLRRGWKNSSRQPVKNRDLWEPLIDLVTRPRHHLVGARAVVGRTGTARWPRVRQPRPPADT